MRSIKRRFDIETKQRPFHSSYICFAGAVKRQGFTRKTISYWFNNLVDKDDYQPSDFNSLVSHMCKLSNMPEECTFSTKNASRGAESAQTNIGTNIEKKDCIMKI